MSKKTTGLILFLPLLCLVVWVVFLTAMRQSGAEVKVAITGYDPRDLLSGHYISYQIDWQKTDCSQFANSVCPQEDFCKDARWGRECRFYIPERHAEELDKLFRGRETKNTVFEVIYSYKTNKFAIAKQLLINGVDWRQTIKEEK